MQRVLALRSRPHPRFGADGFPPVACVLVALALVATVTGGCSRRDGGSPAGTGPVRLTLQNVATVEYPVFLTAPPGDVHRLFVLEKLGRVRVIVDDSLLSTPFLDVSSLVSTGDEQGLLSLAFAPDYPSSGRFYICYTDLAGSTIVARYHVSADPNVAAPAGEIVISAPHPEPSHNGGMIAFGPDGMLYVGIGDGHGITNGDPTGTGQDRSDLLGDLLRIDVRGASGYTVPAGNPFSPPDRPEVWCYGLRNPWRFSFDRANGDLYIGDVGNDAVEEVDYASARSGGARGLDFGWNIMEGNTCFDPDSGCDHAGLTLPVYAYPHPNGACRAVIAGYVYRGQAVPALRGTFLFGDYCAGQVHSFVIAGGASGPVSDWPDLAPGGALTSFGEDARGELYVMSDHGRVARIVPAP